MTKSNLWGNQVKLALFLAPYRLQNPSKVLPSVIKTGEPSDPCSPKWKSRISTVLRARGYWHLKLHSEFFPAVLWRFWDALALEDGRTLLGWLVTPWRKRSEAEVNLQTHSTWTYTLCACMAPGSWGALDWVGSVVSSTSTGGCWALGKLVYLHVALVQHLCI